MGDDDLTCFLHDHRPIPIIGSYCSQHDPLLTQKEKTVVFHQRSKCKSLYSTDHGWELLKVLCAHHLSNPRDNCRGWTPSSPNPRDGDSEAGKCPALGSTAQQLPEMSLTLRRDPGALPSTNYKGKPLRINTEKKIHSVSLANILN